MLYTFNNPNFKTVRQDLRKQMTDPEMLLWSRIKNQQLDGHKFRRQYSIGPYIVDFYCPRLKLVIEIDGGQHAERENEEYDRSRTDYFKSMNIKVVRFWNNEVLNNLDGVYQNILAQIKGQEKLNKKITL